jgi:hypothetical protein
MSDMYFKSLPDTSTPLIPSNLDKLNDIKISPTEPTTNEKVWIQKGKNLIDYSKCKQGYTIDTTTGNISQTDTGRYITDFIKIKGGETYTSSGVSISNRAYFDENMQYISRTSTFTAVAPQNACYTVLVSSNEGYSSPQLEQGSSTEYEPYVEKAIYVKNDNGVFEEFIKYEKNNWIVGVDYNTSTTETWRGNVNYKKTGNIVQVRALCFPSNSPTVLNMSKLVLCTLKEGFRPPKTIAIPLYAKNINNVTIKDLYAEVTDIGEVRLSNPTTVDVNSIAYFCFNTMYFVD